MVVYLAGADNVSGPVTSCPHWVNQPGMNAHIEVAQFIAVCRSVKTSYKMRISVHIFKSLSRPQETLIHADSLTSPSPFQY
jgi:hypothetical protein